MKAAPEQGVVGRWQETAAPVRPGRRRLYSDPAITCALTLREVYHLPLRSTQGLVRSLLWLMGHSYRRRTTRRSRAGRLVAFSCKGRGVCPSRNARRMVEVAAHLIDHVLPPLPVPQ